MTYQIHTVGQKFTGYQKHAFLAPEVVLLIPTTVVGFAKITSQLPSIIVQNRQVKEKVDLKSGLKILSSYASQDSWDTE